MRWKELDLVPCSVARALSVVGDRWTLLVLRDCFLGIRRFEDFQARLRITRHVLADRLRKLVRSGVLERHQYQERPRRHEYRLTAKGRDLYPVLMTLIQWGDRYMADEDQEPPMRFRNRWTGEPVEPILVDRATGQPLDPRAVTPVAGSRPAGVSILDGAPRGAQSDSHVAVREHPRRLGGAA